MDCRSLRGRAVVGVPLALLLLGALSAVSLASQRTITASQALGVASAISVRHADLPSYKQASNPITAQENRASAQLTACVGGVPLSQALANTQSPNFSSTSGKSVTVNSGVEILPSTALVGKDFAAITGQRGLPCLLTELRGELVGKPAQGETVSSHASHLEPEVSGASGSFADRFSVVLTVTHGNTTLILPLYVDLVGFSYGQAEVSLSVMAVGAKPSGTLERRLARLLLARARTAIG